MTLRLLISTFSTYLLFTSVKVDTIFKQSFIYFLYYLCTYLLLETMTPNTVSYFIDTHIILSVFIIRGLHDSISPTRSSLSSRSCCGSSGISSCCSGISGCCSGCGACGDRLGVLERFQAVCDRFQCLCNILLFLGC